MESPPTAYQPPRATGIPQGSPLSPILYILYNGDLLDIPKRKGQLGLDYIDDILYGVQNKMALGNTRELKQLLIKIWKMATMAWCPIWKIQIYSNTLHTKLISKDRSISHHQRNQDPTQHRRKILRHNLQSKTQIPCPCQTSSGQGNQIHTRDIRNS